MRIAALFGLILILFAACSVPGGNEQEYPEFDGAQEVETQNIDFSDIQFDYSNGGVAVYESSDPFDQVAGYYQDGVTNNGWTVEATVPSTEGQSISYLSQENNVVIAQVLTGIVAQDQAEILNEALDTDFAEFQDDDTVIILTHLTCDEDGAPMACIESLVDQ